MFLSNFVIQQANWFNYRLRNYLIIQLFHQTHEEYKAMLSPVTDDAITKATKDMIAVS